MVNSTESAITSLLINEDFIPACPMAIPSVTVIVVNSLGVPPANLIPFFADCACLESVMLHGAASFQVVATPTKGFCISLFFNCRMIQVTYDKIFLYCIRMLYLSKLSVSYLRT